MIGRAKELETLKDCIGSSGNLVETPVAVLTTEHTETRVRGTLKAARKRPLDTSLTYITLHVLMLLNGAIGG